MFKRWALGDAEDYVPPAPSPHSAHCSRGLWCHQSSRKWPNTNKMKGEQTQFFNIKAITPRVYTGTKTIESRSIIPAHKLRPKNCYISKYSEVNVNGWIIPSFEMMRPSFFFFIMIFVYGSQGDAKSSNFSLAIYVCLFKTNAFWEFLFSPLITTSSGS